MGAGDASGLHPTACPLDCPDACGVLVETDGAGDFVRVRGNPEHPWSKGALCGKTSNFGDVVTAENRLSKPLLRNARGGFDEVSWDRALGVTAERLGEVSGPDLLALSYGGSMGLVARKFPMRVLHALGCTETDGTICDSTAEAGYVAVLGACIGPDMVVAMEDADVVLVWGCDARRTNQHLLPRLKRAAQRGAKLWVIDIWRTETVRLIEQWGGKSLIVEPGSDALLALGLTALAFEERAADLDYLKERCFGAAEFRAHVAGRFGADEVEAGSGVKADSLRSLAADLHGARAPLFKLGVGFGRRRNGGMSVRAVCSLAAVLGAADGVHWESGDHFDISTDELEGERFRPEGEERPPKVSHVGLGRTLVDGRFHAAVVYGHNPAVTVPDSGRVRAGLARDDMFLVVHELFMTETAKLADVVLPAAAFVEQTDVYKSYGHRVMQVGRAACRPRGEARSNVATFRSLGERLGLDPEVWDHNEADLVELVLNSNRERFVGEELERLRAGEPVQLDDLQPLRRAGHGTPSGLVQLVDPALVKLGTSAMADWVPDDGAGMNGRFGLVSAPSIATHNSTYAHSTRHMARAGEPVAHLHPDDAADLGLEPGAAARLHNVYGALTLPVALCEHMPRGLVRVDGFPDEAAISEGAGINVLASPEISDLGGGNVLYSVRVDIG